MIPKTKQAKNFANIFNILSSIIRLAFSHKTMFISVPNEEVVVAKF